MSARRIDPAGPVGHAPVEIEGRTHVVEGTSVTYGGLTSEEQDREKVGRVLAGHADGCPVARSLKGAIETTTALAEPGAADARLARR